jgi:hypothetical protein
MAADWRGIDEETVGEDYSRENVEQMSLGSVHKVVLLESDPWQRMGAVLECVSPLYDPVVLPLLWSPGWD